MLTIITEVQFNSQKTQQGSTVELEVVLYLKGKGKFHVLMKMIDQIVDVALFVLGTVKGYPHQRN